MPDDGEPGAPVARKRGLYVLAAIVISWVGFTAWLSPSSLPPVMCDAERAADPDTVVMLSASWCGYCRRARDFFQRSGIAYCEYDVETSAAGRSQFAALPVKLVPVIRIRDDTLFGFNRTEIRQSLIAHGLADFDGSE